MTAVKTVLRTVPVTLALVVLMWILFVAYRGDAPAVLGYHLPGDTTLWHVGSSGLTGGHVVAMVYLTAAALLFAVPAEYTLGSRRFAVAAVAIQAVAVPAGLLAAAAVEEAGFNHWGSDLTHETLLSPVAWVFGPLAFATAQMGVMWRRRLRLVMLALTGTLVLYSGSLADVVALFAVLVGWAAGALVAGSTGTSTHMSLRESRVIVAALVVAVAVGPVLTALNPTAQGPFAGVSQLMWEPAVASHQVAHWCRDTASTACQEAISINHQKGVGPFLLNMVPIALTTVLALGLARGRRLAWALSVAVTVCSLLAIGLQAGGLDGSVTAGINLGMVILPWVVVLAVLIATRKRFTLPSAWRPAAAGVVGALVLTAAFWVIGALLLRHGFLTPPTLGAVLTELPRRYLPPAISVLLPYNLVPHSGAAWALYEWVGIVFWAVTLVILYRVLSASPSPAAEGQRARAREILKSGTGDHLAWMGLWDGNRYFFHRSPVGAAEEETGGAAPDLDEGADGYVAYRVSHNIAVTVGAPVWGASSTRDEVAAAFEDFAAAQGWRVAWYSVDAEFSRPGFRTIHVAEESLLYTDNLEFKGKKFQNIRTARNRAGKEGVSAVWTSWADCPVETHEKIIALSEQWVADKALPEMGFTLGGLDELRDPDTKLLLAIDESGRLHGVTSWLPVYESGRLVGYTLDFMRRDTSGFRPVIEFLLAEAAIVAGGLGLDWVSLSGAPLARSDTPTSLVEVLLDKTGAGIEPLYGFRSLAASKYKFHPTHRGWYLAYDDEMALVSIALAVVSCYLPNMKGSDMAAVAREFLSRRAEAEQEATSAGAPAAGRGGGSSQADAPTPRP